MERSRPGIDFCAGVDVDGFAPRFGLRLFVLGMTAMVQKRCRSERALHKPPFGGL
jgi:hypothetical protein